MLNLRKMAEVNAINKLLTKFDQQIFISKFGVVVSVAPSLIEAKTLTISKLMNIIPTVDPSPFLYNNTMYTRAGMVSFASAPHLWSAQSTRNTLRGGKRQELKYCEL